MFTKLIELTKEIAPGVLTALVTIFSVWLINKIKKIAKYMEQIPDMRCDIKETKEMARYTFRRLDAQDSATTQLFRALKNGVMNGEAKEAIDTMNDAKQESDFYLQSLTFGNACVREPIGERS